MKYLSRNAINKENENVFEILRKEIDKMLDDLKFEEQKRENEEFEKEEESGRLIISSLSSTRENEIQTIRTNIFQDFSIFCDSEVRNVQKQCFALKFEFQVNFDDVSKEEWERIKCDEF